MNNELYHYGVKGMKWGVRRRRPDFNTRSSRKNEPKKELTPEEKKARTKKALKVGAAVAGAAVATYGAYKVHDMIIHKNFELRVQQGKRNVDKILSSGITDRHRGMSTDDLIRANRLEREIIENTMNRAMERARKDTFSTAAKNVGKHYVNQAKQKAADRASVRRSAQAAKAAAVRAREAAQDEWLKERLKETAARNTFRY